MTCHMNGVFNEKSSDFLVTIAKGAPTVSLFIEKKNNDTAKDTHLNHLDILTSCYYLGKYNIRRANQTRCHIKQLY